MAIRTVNLILALALLPAFAFAGTPALSFQFGSAGIASGVTPGGSTAWINTLDADPFTAFLTDDDHDGVVRFQSSVAAPGALWGVVDVTDGAYAVGAAGEAFANVSPFPAGTFLRDAGDKATILSVRLPSGYGVRWGMLWVRPSIGAWYRILHDGNDEDGTANGTVVTSSTRFSTLSGARPAEFAVGDVVIAMQHARTSGGPMAAYASTLAPGFDAPVPGVLRARDATITAIESLPAQINVIRMDGLSGTATVSYTTVDGSALAGVHYVATSGTLTFNTGESIKTIQVPTLNDAVYTGAHSFRVVLSNAAVAALGTPAATDVSLQDNDPIPRLSLIGPGERHVLEQDMPFPVTIELTLTGATTLPAVVDWSASSHRVSASGTVTFAPGETSKSITFNAHGDTLAYGEDRILIDFRGRSGVEVETRFVSVIVDENDLIRITAYDATVSENAVVARVRLTMTPAPFNMSVSFRVDDGTAKETTDYLRWTTTASFEPFATETWMLVPIVNDSIAEDNETFTIEITPHGGALIDRNVVTVTIVDDDRSAPRRRTVRH